MYRVVTYSKYRESAKDITVRTHELDVFPNWEDMIRICREDNIRAVDFSHKKMHGYWVGKFHRSTSDFYRTGARYGVRFYVFGNKPEPRETFR